MHEEIIIDWKKLLERKGGWGSMMCCVNVYTYNR